MASVTVGCDHRTRGHDVGSYPIQVIVLASQSAQPGPAPISTPVTFPAAGFTDVGEGSPFADPVDWSTHVGITTGYPDDTFRATTPVTRAQVVNMLWVMADRPAVATPHGFRDVAAGAFYRQALNWAKTRGLVSGYPGNRFVPNDPVNRGQLVNMAWKLVGAPGGSPPSGYTDVPTTFRPAVNWARAQGLTAAFAPATTFRPALASSRGLVVRLLRQLSLARDGWRSWTRPPLTTWSFDDAEVYLDDNLFLPRRTTILVGETVRWQNIDTVSHDVTSTGGITFAHPLGQNAFVHQRYPTAGTFPYTCELHPGMNGVVTVT
jgi:hypothetical protein